MRIRLPWPPKELSPNARQHWAKHAKEKKLYRLLCYRSTLPHRLQKPDYVTGDASLRLEVTFYKPNRRSMDRDNLLARMKAGIDGVCDALGIDDKRFATVVVKVSDEVGGYVVLEVTEEVYEKV